VADIFGLQQELSERAALAMKITLSQYDLDKLAARPTSSLAAYEYYLRGREYFARHYEANYNFAITLYQKALQIDPKYALAYAGLGEAYLALYDWYMKREASIVDTAEICIKKALTIDPNLPEAHAAYGDLHRLRGADKLPQAIAEYLVAIRLNPNQAEALFHLTRLHREAGNFAEAAIWGKKCLQIQPMNAEACIEMAMVNWFQGYREEATRYFDRAIEMEPDHPISYGQKAFFAFCNGQWEQAKALYERNLELDPRSSQALGALARIAFSEGQAYKAISLYKQLMQIGADGMDYFNLGQIYLLKGDFAAANACRDSALAVSQRLLQRNPEDHRWLSDLAIAHAAKGDAAKALKYIIQAKQTRDFQANFIRRNRVLLRETMVFSLLAKNDEALATLQQLLSLHMYAPEYLRRYIGLENVRRDPRFAKLTDTK
jgi:protein kinase/serine/threonine-protein kinase